MACSRIFPNVCRGRDARHFSVPFFLFRFRLIFLSSRRKIKRKRKRKNSADQQPPKKPTPSPVLHSATPHPRTTNLRLSLLAGFLATLAIALAPALAKRAAPAPVAAVTVGEVEYSVPLWEMGFVVATDLKTRKELWRVRVYEVKIDPLLEEDVQHVFIKTLTHAGGVLLVSNERGASFTLDPATRRVTKRK